MINVDKLIIKEVCDIIAFNNAGKLEFIMDEIKNVTISNGQDKSDITGRNGRKIGSLKKNKTTTISGANGIIVGGALAAQTGTDIVHGKNKIKETDILIVNTNTANTEYEAIGVAGNELGYIYKKDPKTGVLDTSTPLVQVAGIPSTGEFSYNPGTKLITFADGDLSDGDELVVFYMREVESAKLTNDSNTYSKVLKTYVNVICQDNCDNVYHGQYIINRADFSGTFDIEIGEEPAVHNFELESLAGGCQSGSNLWDFIVF